MKVYILGTKYNIEYKTDEEVAKEMLVEAGECGGYCNPYNNSIVISVLNKCADGTEAKKNLIKRNLRHEIIHAFLHESGLHENSEAVNAWATSEEIVDWIALQFPKILKAFNTAGAI